MGGRWYCTDCGYSFDRTGKAFEHAERNGHRMLETPAARRDQAKEQAHATPPVDPPPRALDAFEPREVAPPPSGAPFSFPAQPLLPPRPPLPPPGPLPPSRAGAPEQEPPQGRRGWITPVVIVGALLSLMVGISVTGREAPESTMPEAYEEEAVEEEITPPPVASPPVNAPPVQAQPTPGRQVTSEYEDFTRDTGLPPPDLRNPDGSYVYTVCEGDYHPDYNCYPYFDELDRYLATRP